jgi:2-iminobutanoate/2-iminopropanoate deaminase
MHNPVRSIHTDHAPKAIGPYSQAVAAGPFLFISGQLGIDPKVGAITAETIEGQTKQALQNIEAILVSEGLTFKDVVKTEVFLKKMEDFPAMNALYAESFDQMVKPARVTIQAAKLPLDGLVEIACVAFINN